MAYEKISGSKFVTGDSNVSGGRPCRVFGVCEVYGAASVGSVLRNGTSAAGDIYIPLKSTDSQAVITSWQDEGYLFPNGLFIDYGTNVTSCLIQYHVEQ